MTVEIGGTVIFECVYGESQATATWRINRLQYAYSTVLPTNHRVESNVSGSFLTVHNIDSSMDGNTYQCIVDTFYSTIGQLFVIQGIIYVLVYCFTLDTSFITDYTSAEISTSDSVLKIQPSGTQALVSSSNLKRKFTLILIC